MVVGESRGRPAIGEKFHDDAAERAAAAARATRAPENGSPRSAIAAHMAYRPSSPREEP